MCQIKNARFAVKNSTQNLSILKRAGVNIVLLNAALKLNLMENGLNALTAVRKFIEHLEIIENQEAKNSFVL
ncbi:MAG: hypothetical protein PHI60_02975 [Candidatus Omnitrophica bacterium]|nr:hypothetical protein [Candidatus Omnitrophota bacterium]